MHPSLLDLWNSDTRQKSSVDACLGSEAKRQAALQVDVIVSEWMGYTLLFETMLDSVLHARDR